MNLNKISFSLSIFFWPFSLFLTNKLQDFLVYTLPALLIIASFHLSKTRSKYSFLPLLLIPLISAKLAVFPFIFLLLDKIFSGKSKKQPSFLPLLLSTLVLIWVWKPFFGQSIFPADYEARQKVIRDQQLYPSIPLARTFHNKVKIISDKFLGNFFSLVDPNNYFFGFHPRENIENQNLNKFPFVALPVFIYGLYKLNENRDKRFFLLLITSSALSLSFLSNPDRNDFILWVPLSFSLYWGFFNLTNNFKRVPWFTYIYFLFLLPEFFSVILRFTNV